MRTGNIHKPPDSKQELEAMAEDLLKRAGVYGVLPTPLEALFEYAGVKCVEELPEKEAFLKSLSKKAGNAAVAKFESALRKIRGIADLRDDVVYVPQGQSNERDRFAKSHEISHQEIPWHRTTDPYIDTAFELSPSVQDEFEREANYMAAELNFQGDHFRLVALDFKASISAALYLAEQHGMSKHATLWKLAEIQDEKICVAQYWPIDKSNHSKGFRLDKTVGSEPFNQSLAEIELPQIVDCNHDWFSAISISGITNGTINLTVDGHTQNFEWSAWSNTYTLFIMLRDKPLFHRVGGIIQPKRKLILPKEKILS